MSWKSFAALLAALLAAGAAGLGAQTDPLLSSQIERAAGPWELSNPAGSRTCRIQFRPERSGVGFALSFEAACQANFPAVAGVAAWTIGPTGGIRWLDRSGAALFDFDETELGMFEALRPGDPSIYFLTHLGLAGAAPPPADEVAGAWTLAQPRGRALCALTLEPELAPDAAPLEQRFVLRVGEGCERSIAALGLAHWRLEREILVLGGAGPGALAFRREAEGRWIRTPQDNRPLVLTRP